MIRFLKLGAVLAMLASAFMLYWVSYDTRQLEQRVSTLSRAVDKAALEIAVLRAERAHLARPERIERLARGLGLVPIGPLQYEILKTSASGAAP